MNKNELFKKSESENDENKIMQILFPKFNPNKEYADPELALFYQNLKRNEFWLEGEINLDTCGFLIKYIRYLNITEMEEELKKPLIIHFNSNGGLLDTMFALYDTIKKSKKPIYGINEGICHSAALIIFLACDKRFMNPNAYFIAHEGYGGASGSYRESKAAMAQYDYEVDKMAQFFSNATNLSVEDIKKHYEAASDWYIRYDDAKEHGIITDEGDI